MSWVATAAVGSAVAGNYLNSQATKDAADAQRDASNRSIALEREMWETGRADLAPYRDAGVNALGQMQNFQMPNFSIDNFQASPDYQFRLTQGLDDVNTAAGAGLMRNSGRTMKALEDYRQDTAAGEYSNWYGRQMGQNQDQWNRYAQMAGLGGNATSQAVNANQNTANAISQQYGNIGNANSAAAMQPANYYNNMMNQGMQAYALWK